MTTMKAVPATCTTSHRAALAQVRAELKQRFFERDDVVDGLLTALLAQLHVVLLGPPGTAKSALVNSERAAHAHAATQGRRSRPPGAESSGRSPSAPPHEWRSPGVAEAHGNRTRRDPRRGVPTGFEDRAAHQLRTRLRGGC